MKNTLTKNILLQTTYQIFNAGFPLLIAPYIARVLGSYQLGLYSYSSSVLTYFTLFAMLGTVNYGTRCISEVRDDKNKLSITFWSIYYLQFSAAILFTCIYYVYVLLFTNENQIIFALQGINIIACVFDISWLYFGLEKFSITVLRSFIIRLFTLITVFFFVNNANDLNSYIIITAGSTLISLLVLWINIFKYINFIEVKLNKCFIHLKNNLVLFVPLFAMSIYHVMDKTMLGYMCDLSQSGYYYNADKVINIPISVLNGIGVVLLPTITALYSKKLIHEALTLFEKSLDYVAFASIALASGIVAVSNEFIPLFFGDGYYECILLITVLSPVLVVKGITNTVRTNYLIPLKKENIFIISVIHGAVVNIILNIILIPRAGALGAVIGTLIAEVVSCMVQFHYIKNEIHILVLTRNICIYFLMGIVLVFVIRLSASLIRANMLNKLLLEILIGFIFYNIIGIIIIKVMPESIYKVIFSKYRDTIKRIGIQFI